VWSLRVRRRAAEQPNEVVPFHLLELRSLRTAWVTA
jgi:hypothetical protein